MSRQTFAAGLPVLKKVPEEQLSAEQQKAKIVARYEKSVNNIWALPAGTLTGKAQSDMLMVFKYSAMSFIMTHDIVEKYPGAKQKFKNPQNDWWTFTNKEGKLNFSLKFINEEARHALLWAKEYYNFVVEEAEAAGVMVLKEMPTVRKVSPSSSPGMPWAAVWPMG